MLSKKIYFRIIFTVLLLVVNALFSSFMIVHHQYEIAIISGTILVFQVIALISYFNKTNKLIAYFFNAVKNEDFNLHFSTKQNGGSIAELKSSLNDVNLLLKKLHQENRDQERYYQDILNQINQGLLTIDKKGHILFANPAAERLLNYHPLTHIKQLKQVDKKLYQLFENITPNNHQQFNLSNEKEVKQLLINTNSIQLEETELNVIHIQNIQNELDEKETDSWMKLIRVMTHEIMNSITPITSISDSLLNNNSKITADDTRKGLEIINQQSDDLMHFVESYRDVLSVPRPDKNVVKGSYLMNKVSLLIRELDHFKSISLEVVNDEDLEFFIDEQQITQVLVNLCKNAIDALVEVDQPLLKLHFGKTEKQEKFIAIEDNGSGISEELVDQIFIPFFTTKTSGTGIGLSLSKRIIQMHEGSLSVKSTPFKSTTFTIILP